MRRKVQSPQIRNNLTRKTDRRVLKESGTCTAKGALLEESGNTRDDGVRKRISFKIRDGVLAGPTSPAMVGCPEIGPDTVDPAQTATSRVNVKAKGVAASSTRRCSENQRRKGQEVGPRSDVTVGDDINKSNNKATRPSVASTKRDR